MGISRFGSQELEATVQGSRQPGDDHSPRALGVAVESGDALDVREFAVRERISTLFEIVLVAVSKNADIDFDSVVGRPASFQLLHGETSNQPPRFWTGICKHIEQIAV